MSEAFPSEFHVDVIPDRERVIVVPHGDLDLLTVGDLHGALKQLTDQGFENVVVDLRELTFIDSSGVRLLVQQEVAARESGHDFAIIDEGDSTVSRVLEMTGLTDQFTHGTR